jgi:pSer/pThr/pTyr-binding forkhead associated (FHA) protein
MAQTDENIPTLVAQAGPLNGQRWPLSESTTIGRETDCDIIVPSRQVSRFHARITIDEDGVFLEDLASKNGTHINGKILLETVRLQDGDIIQIALAQQFVYISSDATLPLEATPLDEIITVGPNMLRLEKRSRRVWVVDSEILPPLSVSQFKLLEILYEHQGRVVSRNMLIHAVWGEELAVGVSEQALDALIRRLRDRLAAIDPKHNYIITVRGHGLRLENPTLN